MAYGLQYHLQFTNIDDNLVDVEISAKDSTPFPILLDPCGSSPVVISYKSGDFYANDPLRASTCQIKYYYSGVGGLSNFANVDDTYWKVDVYLTKSTKKLIWTGFISQDDSIEELTPQPNEVTLNCNDGIGMLKYSYFADDSGVPYPGDSLHQMKISDVFKTILNTKTGLSLPVNIYCNIFENAMNDRSISATNEPFSQTKIDVRSFLLSQNTTQDFASGVNAQIVQVKDKVQDNYTIMQNLLDAWGCTILQANGEWNIIRWHELKQFNNAIPGTKYSADFTTSSAVTFNYVKDISNDYPTINLSQNRQLFRPNKFNRNTFQYEQTNNLIQNSDWSSYGALLGTLTTGSGIAAITTKDYVLNDWTVDTFSGTPPCIGYVRITYNSFGAEIDRYACVQSGTVWNAGTPAGGGVLISEPIMVSKGDQGILSFSFRTDSNNTSSVLGFNLVIHDRSNTYQYSLSEQGWDTATGHTNPGDTGSVTYMVKPLADWVDWATYELVMPPIPADGDMYFFLENNNISATRSFYKDVQLNIYTYIDGSVQVNGQYNESSSDSNSKKNINKPVYFDDAPKITLKGCMYLVDGITKTSSWHRAPLVEDRRFGFIQTVDWEYLSSVYRVKVDGQYRNITDSTDDYLSALCVCQISDLGTENYIFGQCSFDLKQAEFQGTLQEVYKTGEYSSGYTFPGTEFTNTFSYLYAKK